MIRLDEKDASMDYAPRWIYQPERKATDDARAFVGDLAVGLLVLFAMVGAVTVFRLFANAVTP